MADFIEMARVDSDPAGIRRALHHRRQGRRGLQRGRNDLRHRRYLPSRRRLAGNGKARRQDRDLSRHGMKFDVTTGCFAGTSDFGVASFPAKVVDGEIMVALGPKE